MKKMVVWLASAIVSFYCLAPGASAGTISDPATLFIGNPPTAGDPNQIGNSGLVVINQNSGGAPTLNQPVLLILGIPNGGSNFFGGVDPITSVTSSAGGTPTFSLGGTNVYAGSWGTTSGFGGTMFPSSGTNFAGGTTTSDAYRILGVTPPTTASENGPNWFGADLTINGISPSEFDLYVFELNASLVAKGSIDVQFPSSGTGSLPLGTYSISYGQSGAGKSLKTWSTPFTEAGLTTSTPPPPPPPPVIGIPEPASVLLLALGGIGLLGFGWSRRRRLAVA